MAFDTRKLKPQLKLLGLTKNPRPNAPLRDAVHLWVLQDFPIELTLQIDRPARNITTCQRVQLHWGEPTPNCGYEHNTYNLMQPQTRRRVVDALWDLRRDPERQTYDHQAGLDVLLGFIDPDGQIRRQLP